MRVYAVPIATRCLIIYEFPHMSLSCSDLRCLMHLLAFNRSMSFGRWRHRRRQGFPTRACACPAAACRTPFHCIRPLPPHLRPDDFSAPGQTFGGFILRGDANPPPVRFDAFFCRAVTAIISSIDRFAASRVAASLELRISPSVPYK